MTRNNARTKTNPDHKASFSYGVTARCSCGWSGANWLGQGAKSNAAGEWRHHREKCERMAAEAVTIDEALSAGKVTF